ncbi:MAG: hypothetical protein JWM37_57 [Candidatus Saccharibacteria bacterium]|nr:hypothetical protein [Candidatus Saccharibacteria bacterium]
MYARELGTDYHQFRSFFQGVFQDALVGKADLKELISEHEDLWHADGNVDALLARWFSTEDARNEPMLALVASLRSSGTPCYLATNQEKYRGEYIRDVMFKDEFNAYFVSAFIGSKKPSPEYFRAVLAEISARQPGIQPSDILFLDDSPEHIEGAKEVGLDAHLFTSTEQAYNLLSLPIAR